jgi:hypothetical protein
MRTLSFITVLFVTGLLFSVVASARWAEPSEASYAVNFERRTYKIRKDGSATITIETQIEILKDSARESQGLTRFTYDSSISSVKILEAKTIDKDGTFDVPKQDREDKPLASRGAGFDVINQVTIAFPRVNVGSKLYMKTEETQRRAIIPGYFFTLQALWGRSYQSYSLDVESEIPIYFDAHDPEGFLDVKTSAKKIHVTLKRPYFKSVVEESNEFYDTQNFVWFSYSTAKDWTEFPKETLAAYEKDLSSPLPKPYWKIAEKAKTKKTPIDQINVVTSEVASLIRYNGEWRELEGLWHPRGLETITTSGFGDCKDFSVSTGAILRQLGFDTRVAWLMRRREFENGPLDDKVLNVNHAIVRAEKGGQVYWIDPTNLTSQAQTIYADIANRRAYVLYADKIVLDRTPSMAASQGEMKFKTTVDFSKWKAEGVADFRGRTAQAWTGNELRSDKRAINYSLIGWVADRSGVMDWSMGSYDLTSRIVQNISIPFSYSLVPTLEQTTSGPGFEIRAPFFVDHFRVRRARRVTDLLLANPQTLSREYDLKGRAVQLAKPIKCEGDSPWASFKREITQQPVGAKLTDRLEIKVLHIPAKDLQSKEFEEFQTKILNCMQETIVVFK